MSIASNYPNVRPSLLLDFANSQQLDPRVTFSRSTTAPYYDGKTSVLAEQNLYTNSQNITNGTWNPGNVTLTVNSTTAPDGTTTASLAVPNTSNASHNISQSALGNLTGTYTFSVYVKPAGYTTFIIANSAQTLRASFDLTAVTNTNTGAVTSTITAVQNGFYRVTLTATISADFFYFFINGLGAYVGDGTSGVYLWGFQVEQRSSVTAYNATTTPALTNYIPQLLTAPINSPRFDFNPTTGESLGLLIEQSSTNLLTYSQDFSNASWGKIYSTITTGANIAPDGTQTASKMVEDSTTNYHIVQYSYSLTSGTFTFSVFAKQAERKRFLIREILSSGNGAIFDLSTGSVVSNLYSGVGTITSVGNGMYRCSVTSTETTGTRIFGIYLATDTTTTVSQANYTGNGYSGIYIWGSQLEALAFPTSYIPTTLAQVTRASDNASMTGTNFSSWYNQNASTIFSNWVGFSSTSKTSFGLANPTVGDISLVESGANLRASCYFGAGGPNVSITGPAYATRTNFREAFAVTTNIANYVVNGTSYGTSSSVSLPTPTTAYIGRNASGNTILSGWISKISYYPQALTSAQLQALTGS
jgi:hypothetical protein